MAKTTCDWCGEEPAAEYLERHPSIPDPWHCRPCTSAARDFLEQSQHPAVLKEGATDNQEPADMFAFIRRLNLEKAFKAFIDFTGRPPKAP